MNDNVKKEEKEKTSILLLCKNGFFITRYQETAPQTIVMPVNLANDKRLFLRNGEVMMPFEVVTFKHVYSRRAAGLKVALYEEVSRAEFDPTGLMELAVRGLDKEFDELNGGNV